MRTRASATSVEGRRVRDFESEPVASRRVDNLLPLSMRAKWIDRALLIAIIWLALGLRLSQLDAVPHDYDRSYPHGVAIALLDSMRDGTFGSIALHGQAQSLGLPNPIGANYALALLAMVDRSPYFAMVAIAIANTLVVAIAYNIARRTDGRIAGLVAATLAATSPWAIYFARGVWQLSLFELSIAAPAWLLWRGHVQHRPTWILSGIVVAAFSMHVYTVGFGMLLQIAAVMVVTRRDKPMLRAPLIVGCVAGALSLALYAAVLLAANADLFSRQTIRLAYGGEAYGGALAGMPINMLGVARALGVVGGGEFEDIVITSVSFADPIRALLLQARSLLVALAITLGLIVLVRKWRSSTPARLTLVWFLAPVIAITAVTTLSRATPVNHYYVLLISPMGYVCGGAGFAWLVSLSWAKARRSWRPAVAAAWMATVVAAVLIPLSSLVALAAQQLALKNADSPLDLSLRTQQSIARTWSTHCRELSVPFNPFENRLDLQYWAISLVGSKSAVRPTTEAVFGPAQLWTTRDDGGTCSIRMLGAPAPPGAAAYSDVDGAPVRIYRSAPIAALPSSVPPRADIGWDLGDWSIPPGLQPGDPAQIDVEWRIATVPGEPHAKWRFDLFVKLFDPIGRVAAQGDVLGPQGSAWRAGDIVRQRLTLAVPNDLKAGRYTLELSLYDRDRQRTATFSRSAITGADGGTLQFQTQFVR